LTEPTRYYDINVQIWSEGDVVYYSVIQEQEENDESPETLVYGETDTFEQALAFAREAVLEALQ
jgi:hypothetical protein